jgi:tRNA (guanine-N7-)-methyltransferase
MKTAKDLKIPYAWPDRYPLFLENFFYIPGFYEGHEGHGPVPWEDLRIFGNSRPVAIEYCSGNGQWIGERAKQDPGTNWVAVEKCFERARKIWLKLHREAIPNLFVVCGDANTFTQYYPPSGTVSEIHVNFPDPWPKRRHAQNRLVRLPFLKLVDRILVPGGKATFVTDDPPYASQMLEELSIAGWRPLLESPFYSSDWNEYGSSFFADLWKEKGRQIYSMPFEKVL